MGILARACKRRPRYCRHDKNSNIRVYIHIQLGDLREFDKLNYFFLLDANFFFITPTVTTSFLKKPLKAVPS